MSHPIPTLFSLALWFPGPKMPHSKIKCQLYLKSQGASDFPISRLTLITPSTLSMSKFKKNSWSMYSCGQPKSTNLVSLEGRNILAIWLQIQTQDVKIHPKTSLGSFSHEELGWPNFWTFSRVFNRCWDPPGRVPMPGMTEKFSDSC